MFPTLASNRGSVSNKEGPKSGRYIKSITRYHIIIREGNIGIIYLRNTTRYHISASNEVSVSNKEGPNYGI